jgi:hypothetical protein
VKHTVGDELSQAKSGAEAAYLQAGRDLSSLADGDVLVSHVSRKYRSSLRGCRRALASSTPQRPVGHSYRAVGLQESISAPLKTVCYAAPTPPQAKPVLGADPGTDSRYWHYYFLPLPLDFGAEKATYTAADKTKILTLLGTLGLAKSDEARFAVLRQNRGRLLARHLDGTVDVVASGRGAWIGWVELTTEPVLERAVENTARVIRDLDPDVLGPLPVRHADRRQ